MKHLILNNKALKLNAIQLAQYQNLMFNNCLRTENAISKHFSRLLFLSLWK